MKNVYAGFKWMLSYFTLLPVRLNDSDDLRAPSVSAAMLFWLPLGGGIIASISVLLYHLLLPIGWFGALIAAVGYMMLYGFLHTEAVMDVADALYAKHSGKDAYSIIKDPTVGAMGILWAIGVVALKLAGIVYLLTQGQERLLIVIAIISRMGLLLLFYTQTFRSTFIDMLKKGFDGRYFYGALILYGITLSFIGGITTWILLPVGLAFTWLFARSVGKKLGFLNGDVLGCTLESTEIVLLVTGAMLWR